MKNGVNKRNPDVTSTDTGPNPRFMTNTQFLGMLRLRLRNPFIIRRRTNETAFSVFQSEGCPRRCYPGFSPFEEPFYHLPQHKRKPLFPRSRTKAAHAFVMRFFPLLGLPSSSVENKNCFHPSGLMRLIRANRLCRGKISATLINFRNWQVSARKTSEQIAQACANAWLQQLTSGLLVIRPLRIEARHSGRVAARILNRMS